MTNKRYTVTRSYTWEVEAESEELARIRANFTPLPPDPAPYMGETIVRPADEPEKQSVTNSCACKAEHWQPHKVDCPAYKPPVAPSSVSTLRLLAKCGSMDLSALGAIADEMERMQKALHEIVGLPCQIHPGMVTACNIAREALGTSHEPLPVASFPALPIDPAADAVVDRLVAERLSKKSPAEPNPQPSVDYVRSDNTVMGSGGLGHHESVRVTACEPNEEPTPHGIIYDRPGWLCSQCGGWNHLQDNHCTHTHPADEVASVKPSALERAFSENAPIVEAALQRLGSQLGDDLMIFGRAFAKRNPDGSIERVDPKDVYIRSPEKSSEQPRCPECLCCIQILGEQGHYEECSHYPGNGGVSLKEENHEQMPNL